MNRRFMRQVVFFALLYVLVALLLDGLIFFLSHIPPQAVNLDTVILVLGRAGRFLAWPRILLRHAWPGETTPLFFNYLGPVVSCLVWGLLLAGSKEIWVRVRK